MKYISDKLFEKNTNYFRTSYIIVVLNYVKNTKLIFMHGK